MGETKRKKIINREEGGELKKGWGEMRGKKYGGQREAERREEEKGEERN